MSAASFPNQLVPEKDKLKPEWGRMHLDYAVALLNSKKQANAVKDKTYLNYNGDKSASNLFNHFSYLTDGKRRAKHKITPIAYRYGRNKLALLEGEYLKRPIKATVTTENIDAKTAKAEQAYFMYGAMASKGAIDALKNIGVDPTNGAIIPESPDDPVWQNMSFKDKYEKMMQVLINNGIVEQDLLFRTSQEFKNILIVSECFHQIEVTDYGKETYIPIDIRDAIFVEIDGDYFLERTPIIGARKRKTISEVLLDNSLTKDQRDALIAAQGGETYYGIGNNKRRVHTYTHGGDLCVDVVHIEWKSSTPTYHKLSPKTQTQKYYSPQSDYYFLPLSTEAYEDNPERYYLVNPDSAEFEKQLKDMPKGKMPVIAKYDDVTWEATRIAGCIDTKVRPKPFQLRKVDTPSNVVGYSYGGFLFGTVDGVRISFFNMIENLDQVFDLTMHNILRELNTPLGKVWFMDRAAVGKDRDALDILYDAVNNRFVTYDSSDDGSIGKQVDVRQIISQQDLGFSSSLPILFQIQSNVMNIIDRITGVNENREGYSAASTTATGVNQSINASRTITEPLFYGFSLYVQKTLMKLAETYKLTFGLFNKDKGRQILGDAMFGFLELTHEIAYQSYGVSIQDGGRYADYKNRLDARMQFGLNTGEITLFDTVKADIAETFTESKNIFESAMKRNMEIAQQRQQQEQEAKQALLAQQQQSEIEKDAASRREKIAGDLEKTREKGRVQVAVKDNDAKNQMHVDYNKAQLEKEKNIPQHY